MGSFKPSVYSNPGLDTLDYLVEGLAVSGVIALAAAGLLYTQYGPPGIAIGLGGGVLATPFVAGFYVKGREALA